MLPETLGASLIETGTQPGDVFVVGVSGGPDSSALAHGLAQLTRTLGIRLWAAHLNHGLRPESDDEAHAVAAFVSTLGMDLTVGLTNVAELAQTRRLGIEEAGRVARYSFFADIIDRLGARGVILGHTADDQLETRLMHILRGTGLGGLEGMTPRSERRLPDGRSIILLRPLLQTSHADTEEYCQANGLTPLRDPTNLDRRFTRNRIRHELIPLLRSFNPQIEASFERLAIAARAVSDAVAAEVADNWDDIVSNTNDVLIHRAPFKAQSRAVQAEVLRRVLRMTEQRDAVAFDTLERMQDALLAHGSGQTVDLAGGLTLRVEREVGRIVDHPAIASLPTEPIAVKLNGETALFGGRLILTTATRQNRCAAPERDPWHVDLDLDALGLCANAPGLEVRRRQMGDRIQLDGLPGQTKLQDFFVDRHVARPDRDAVPIVAGPSGIVWVAGLRADARTRARTTGPVVCLRLWQGQPSKLPDYFTTVPTSRRFRQPEQSVEQDR